jgi:hypothetical protein
MTRHSTYFPVFGFARSWVTPPSRAPTNLHKPPTRLADCGPLQATLLSRRPALRRAAAATLFHLSERDPATLLHPDGQRTDTAVHGPGTAGGGGSVEGAVFAALDNETDAGIAGGGAGGQMSLSGQVVSLPLHHRSPSLFLHRYCSIVCVVHVSCVTVMCQTDGCLSCPAQSAVPGPPRRLVGC